jgi:hypothetical protein
MRKILFVLTGLFLIVLSSCDETSNFFLDLDEEIEISTIESGRVLQGGSEIPLSLEFNSKAVNPDNIVLEYFTRDGLSIGKTEINRDLKSGETLPSIIIPESLEPGLYYLVIRLKEQDSLIKEEKITFFIISGELAINRLTVYPFQLEPKGIAVIKADITVPTGLDPWIRWKKGAQIVMEGRYSDGLASCLYTVPDAIGLYSLDFEVFPEKPVALYAPAWEAQAEIPVMNEIVGETRSLGDKDNYHVLFNFWGSLRDDGIAGGIKKNPVKINRARPDVINGQYGLLMEPDSGLVMDYFLLPVKDGRLEPFTLTFHGNFESTGEESQLVSSRDGSGQADFRILVTREGNFSAVWTLGEIRQELVLSDYPVEALDQKWISLNCYPGETAFSLFWMIDGAVVKKGWFLTAADGLDPGGSTTIGSSENNNGVSGFLDELGVYSMDDEGKPARDPRLFEFCQDYNYRNRLVLAEGFDRDGSGQDSSWEMTTSQLMIRPSGRYVVNDLELPYGDGLMQLGFKSATSGYQEGSLLLLHEENVSEPLLVVNLASMKMTTHNQEFSVKLGQGGKLNIYFSRIEDGYLFKGDPSVTGFPAYAGNGHLTLTILSGNKKDAIILNDLLIIRN